MSLRRSAGIPTQRVVVLELVPLGNIPFRMFKLTAASFAGETTNDGKLNPAVPGDAGASQVFSRSSQNAS